MKMYRCWFLTVPTLMLGLAAQPAWAQQAADKEAIAKNAAGFVEAFHKGDAKGLAVFWADDGDYTDQTGRHLKGRDAIEKVFEGFFVENKGLKLRIDSDTLRFVTPDVAIEDGVTAVFPAEGGPPSRERYSIVHVKKDGKWLLSSVREAPFTPPTNYDKLRGLEWTVGTWSNESGKGEGDRISFSWAENQNFLVCTFGSTFKTVRVAKATQWIGWDPTAKSLRSWIFDGNGGFGDGAWTKEGNKWVVKTHSLFPDGKKMTATYTFTRGEDNMLLFDATERTLDGKPLPDRKELKLKRVQ